MILREYQQRCHAAIFEAWKKHNSTLIVVATGGGKTVIAAHVIKSAAPKRAMVLAHRNELIVQAREKIMAVTGFDVEIEKAELYASQSLYSKMPVVVSSIQTQISGPKDKRRYLRFDPMDFGVLICDEAHHCASSSWKEVIAHYRKNPNLKLLGITATPDRADNEALGQIFESVAFEYGILDAIHDGYLVDITQQFVPVSSLDFSHIRTTAGDLNEGDLSKVMEMEENIQGVCQPSIEVMFGLPPKTLSAVPVPQWREYLAGLNKVPRRTIVFTVSVAQAEMCANIFGRAMDGVEWVCGATNHVKREAILDRFSKGETHVVVNCGVLLEGFDNPGVEVIVMARPTKSRSLYCLDSHTEILTSTGWSNDVSLGDTVAAFNSKTEEIDFVPVTGVVRRKLYPGEQWVSLKSQSANFRVTDKHRMLYDHAKKTGWKIKTASDLIRLSGNQYLPVCGFSKRPGVPLTDDELRFIGWVMTDGTINPKNGQITITQGGHQPWLEEIQKMLDGCGFKNTRFVRTRKSQFKSNSHCVAWTISKGIPRGRDKHLRGWGALEPYISKDFSPILMRDISRDQFSIFLEAMHLGDGCKQAGQSWTRRSYHIVTGNKVMADRLQIVAISNGWRCSISTNKTPNSVNPCYCIHLKNVRFVHCGKRGESKMKIENPILDETCWCVENEIGTIITRRNGRVLIVGNCQAIGRSTRPLPGLVDGVDSASARRGIIAVSPKPFCRVLDFVGNSGRHKLISCTDVLGGHISEEAREMAKEKAIKEGKPVKIMVTMDNAELELERKRQEAAEKARREREARKNHLVAKVDYSLRDVNPFGESERIPLDRRMSRDGRQFSEKQAAVLRRAGYDPARFGYKQGQAVIGKVIEGWKKKKEFSHV